MSYRTPAPLVVLSLALAAGAFTGCATGGGDKAGLPSPAASSAASAEPLNVLTAEEQAAGWQLLFDGKTTAGWRGFRKESFPERGWRVENGILIHDKNSKDFKAGDIVTIEQFDNFELSLEARLTPRGNSGVKYLVNESLLPEKKDGTSFELQVLDDDLHPDAKKGKDGNRTMGSLYDLIPPSADKSVKPIGQWNQVRLVVDGNNIEHWLNGKKVVSFVRGSPELKARIAESKFKDIAGFGENARGHILLQDHNDEIAFRNIKLRKLPAKVAGVAPSP